MYYVFCELNVMVVHKEWRILNISYLTVVHHDDTDAFIHDVVKDSS